MESNRRRTGSARAANTPASSPASYSPKGASPTDGQHKASSLPASSSLTSLILIFSILT